MGRPSGHRGLVGPDLAVLLLATLALALRLYRLQFQSLWWDEGISIYLAGLDLPSLTTDKDFGIDLHPPLYHVLLAGWRLAAGSSDFAMRYLSVVAGALAVPATYALGRRVFGTLAGLAAAALVATSPVLVFYSQEARMYSLMPLLGLLSALVAARVLSRRHASPVDLAALVAVNVAGLYTYYYLGLLLLAENLAFAAVALGLSRSDKTAREAGRPERFVGAWLVAQAATVGLYLPWLIALAGLFASGAALAVPPETAVYHSLAGYLKECLLAFGIGFSRPAPWADLAAGLVLLLAALGLVARPRSRAGWGLLGLGIGVALAGAYAVTLRRPFFYPRFILFGAPYLYLFVGAGLALLWRALGAASASGRLAAVATALGRTAAAAGLLALVGWNARALADHYTHLRTGYSSADYRVVLSTLAREARPGDLVVGTYPWQVGYVAGYLPNAGLAAVHGSADPASRYGVDVPAALRAHPRAWLLRYSASGEWAEDRLEQALDAAARSALVDQLGDSRVRLFSVDPPPLAETREARLGGLIDLLRHDLSPSGDLRPGARLDLTLTWQAVAAIPESYTVFTHVLGPDGKVWAQQDGPPLKGTRPTSGWEPGETLVDRYQLVLPADAPSGEYLVEAGFYLPSTGQRLSVGRSAEEVDRILVGRFRVVP